MAVNLCQPVLGFLVILIYKEPGCQGMSCNAPVTPCGPRLCERLCDTCSLCSVSQYRAEALICFLNSKTVSSPKPRKSSRMIRSRLNVIVMVSEGAHRRKRKGVFVCTLNADIVFIDASGRWSEKIEHKNIEECNAIAYDRSEVYVIDRGGVIKTSAATEEPFVFKKALALIAHREYSYLSVDKGYGFFYIVKFYSDEYTVSKMWIFKRRHSLRERKLVQSKVSKVQVHKKTRSVFYVNVIEELYQVNYDGERMRSFPNLRFNGCFQLYDNGHHIYYFGYDGTNIVHQIIHPMKRKRIVNNIGRHKFHCTFFWRVSNVIGLVFYGKTSAIIIPTTGSKYNLKPFPAGRSLALIDD